MTNLQLHIKPCPYCGNAPYIERALYAPDGHQLSKDEEHPDWIAKCPECGARTEYMPTRLSAIIAWNRGQFDGLTGVLHSDYTNDTDIWYGLLQGITKMAFDDYKASRLGKVSLPGPDANDHSFIESLPAFKKAARDQIPYDDWRDRMDCIHCPAKENECPHKYGYLWIKFKNGKAPDCIRDELLAKLKRT